MKTCSVPGCDRRHSGKGLCKRHYDGLPENEEKASLREKAPLASSREKKPVTI